MKVTLALMLVASVAVGQQFSCPVAGDEAYGSKPMLDARNDATCNSESFLFTQLVTDYTVLPACTMYCASCEAGACQRTSRAVTCSTNITSCVLCADPPGCGDISTSFVPTSSANDLFSQVCRMLGATAILLCTAVLINGSL